MAGHDSFQASLQSQLSQSPSIIGAGSGSAQAVLFEMGADSNITSNLEKYLDAVGQKKGALGAMIGAFMSMQGIAGFAGIQAASLAILSPQMTPTSIDSTNIGKGLQGAGTHNIGQGK
ncbi:MAG: hypothetical protein J0G32_07435 [Alphaproteobacteria bacterium]|nr:hypothetical protein [Alphaproteobacteria bacterium]OJV14134.1 MAG: hypothetical protein BGO27_01440 [Alphaproteobacteria bacterium 33-17]